jgi:Fe-S-cluster containining protein
MNIEKKAVLCSSKLRTGQRQNAQAMFLEEDDCAVQPVKPQQCRDFPNLWNFPGFQRSYQAIPVEMGEEEFGRRIAAIRAKGR